MKQLFNYNEASRILTGNKDQIRAGYSGKKYAEPVRELREFEANFRNKYMNKLEKTVLEFLTSWLESDLSEADIQLNSGQETEIVMNQTDESFDVLAIRFKPEIIQVEQTDPSGCEGTGDYYNELRHIEVLSITADNTEIECVKTIKFVRNTIFNYFENKID